MLLYLDILEQEKCEEPYKRIASGLKAVQIIKKIKKKNAR